MMELQESIKKYFLPICANKEGVTGLSVYAFYIRDTGYQLEVWPFKRIHKSDSKNKNDQEYIPVKQCPGKCITLVPATVNDFIEEINREKAMEILPEASERLIQEILEKYGWELADASKKQQIRFCFNQQFETDSH